MVDYQQSNVVRKNDSQKLNFPTLRKIVMEWITSPEAWIALLTLPILEIVLGIDNIIFISIIVDRLPEHQQKKARLTGLALAMVLRILLLLSITMAFAVIVELLNRKTLD